MNLAKTETDFKQAGSIFASLGDFSDAGQKAEKCLDSAENSRKESLYQSAKTNQSSNDIENLERAIKEYESIRNFKDSGPSYSWSEIRRNSCGCWKQR